MLQNKYHTPERRGKIQINSFLGPNCSLEISMEATQNIIFLMILRGNMALVLDINFADNKFQIIIKWYFIQIFPHFMAY